MRMIHWAAAALVALTLCLIAAGPPGAKAPHDSGNAAMSAPHVIDMTHSQASAVATTPAAAIEKDVLSAFLLGARVGIALNDSLDSPRSVNRPTKPGASRVDERLVLTYRFASFATTKAGPLRL